MSPDTRNVQPGSQPGRLRLDLLLVARGLAPTRTRAQQRIAAGAVTVNGEVTRRASLSVAPDAIVSVLPETESYVSRGGIKLAAALDAWSIGLTGRICLDIGISTGGFTDCMLRRGALRVIGIDSGQNQLAAVLRNDQRVVLHERTNARHLQAGDLPDGISFVTIDVSFIAASLLLPAVVRAAYHRSAGCGLALREAVILVKPQFEAGREFVGHGGIVRDAMGHQRAVERIQMKVQSLGGQTVAIMDSPIPGGDGNREFLLYARF